MIRETIEMMSACFVAGSLFLLLVAVSGSLGRALLILTIPLLCVALLLLVAFLFDRWHGG